MIILYLVFKSYKCHIINKKMVVVKIVTFNIHDGFKSDDGKHFTFYETIEWLKQEDVDVVCFQEVQWYTDFTQIDFEKVIEKELNMYYFAYGNANIKSKDDGKGRNSEQWVHSGFFGQATISRFPIIWQQSILLAPDPLYGEYRNALITAIANYEFIDDQEIIDDIPFAIVINTHLDVFDHSATTRRLQLAKLVKTLHQWTLPTVVVGDFNSIRKQDYDIEDTIIWRPEYGNFLFVENRFESTIELDWFMRNGPAESVFDRLGFASPPTRVGEIRTIDYIWLFNDKVKNKDNKNKNDYKSKMNKNRIQVVDAYVNDLVDTSDHFPVMATLNIVE